MMRSGFAIAEDGIALQVRVAAEMAATFHRTCPLDAPDEVIVHALHRAGYRAREIATHWPALTRHIAHERAERAAKE